MQLTAVSLKLTVAQLRSCSAAYSVPCLGRQYVIYHSFQPENMAHNSCSSFERKSFQTDTEHLILHENVNHNALEGMKSRRDSGMERKG